MSLKVEQYHGPMMNQMSSSNMSTLSSSRNLDTHANILTFPAQNLVMAKVEWLKETKQQSVIDDKTGQEV